jgi:hypothetical protein
VRGRLKADRGLRLPYFQGAGDRREAIHQTDDRLPQPYWLAARVVVELQARQTAMGTHRKLTLNTCAAAGDIREIRAIRGCPRKELIHRPLRVRHGALGNNPGERRMDR